MNALPLPKCSRLWGIAVCVCGKTYSKSAPLQAFCDECLENPLNPSIVVARGQKKWDYRLMHLAGYVSEWSKDESTKVGAVIARGKKVIGVGFNGFPAGVNDDVPERHERPLKYFLTEHAERNAINTAHEERVKLAGCTIYVPLYPCADCARAVIASGIKRVVTMPIDTASPFFERWKDSMGASQLMFREAGVRVDYL